MCELTLRTGYKALRNKYIDKWTRISRVLVASTVVTVFVLMTITIVLRLLILVLFIMIPIVISPFVVVIKIFTTTNAVRLLPTKISITAWGVRTEYKRMVQAEAWHSIKKPTVFSKGPVADEEDLYYLLEGSSLKVLLREDLWKEAEWFIRKHDFDVRFEMGHGTVQLEFDKVE